jgi:hypothetical protein
MDFGAFRLVEVLGINIVLKRSFFKIPYNYFQPHIGPVPGQSTLGWGGG